MTTIAYRDGVLAADTLATWGKVKVDQKCQKLWKLRDGSLVGGSGAYNQVCTAVEILKTILDKREQKDLPAFKLKDADLLFVSANGGGVFLFARGWEDISHLPYFAIGHGRDFALAAMDAGASATEAVKIAIDRDVYTGGRVKSLTLTRQP